MNQWLFFILISSFGSAAIAANTDETLQQAMSLLDKGVPLQAYNLLSKNHSASSKDPQEWFLLAMSSKESGRPIEEAIPYLRKVLEIDPTADRAKLELARLLYKQGKDREAKQYFMEVKANNPPDAVSKNIDSLITQDIGKDKGWNIKVHAGWMYNSNVNSGPNIDSVSIFGLPFKLSSDAKKTSDSAWMTGASFEHSKKLSEKSGWQSSLSVNQVDYKKVDVLDNSTITASTGIAWKANENTVFNVPLVASQVKVGHDKSYYSYSYGVSPQLRHQLNKSVSLGLATSIGETKYNDQGSRDAKVWSLSPSISYQPNEKNNVEFNFVTGQENSGVDVFSNRLLSASTNYAHLFKNGLRSDIGYSYADIKYDAIEPAYTKVRHDKSHTLTAGVTLPIKKLKSDIKLSVSHVDNNSSLEIYNYDRDQVFITLQKQF